jgi:hypothetical protein
MAHTLDRRTAFDRYKNTWYVEYLGWQRVQDAVWVNQAPVIEHHSLSNEHCSFQTNRRAVSLRCTSVPTDSPRRRDHAMCRNLKPIGRLLHHLADHPWRAHRQASERPICDDLASRYFAAQAVDTYVQGWKVQTSIVALCVSAREARLDLAAGACPGPGHAVLWAARRPYGYD